MTNPAVREGFISVAGGRVWYQIVGSGDAIPLLTLHGGPGFPHDYLDSLAALADERPVIFYDQLGCGKSDRPNNLSHWNVEYYVEELSQVCSALGLKQIHLLGQSWGSILATEYMLGKPADIKSLILASPSLSIPRIMAEMNRLVAALPEDIQAILTQHQTAGTIDSEEFQQAANEFYRRHTCRIQPPPEPFQRSIAGFGSEPYQTMWGPNEFTCTGNLINYDCTARVHEITVPTLFTCGRYDECTPESVTSFHNLIPGSELVIFEQSSHMAHLEETELYLQLIRDFIRRIESTDVTERGFVSQALPMTDALQRLGPMQTGRQ